MKINKFLFISFLFLGIASPVLAVEENKTNTNSVMQDCEEALTIVAFQLTFSEMMSVNLSKEQALKAVDTMKESDMSSYLEIRKGAAEACQVFRDEIKSEVNKKPANKESK